MPPMPLVVGSQDMGPLSAAGAWWPSPIPSSSPAMARLAQEGGSGVTARWRTSSASNPTLSPLRRKSTPPLPALPFAASFPKPVSATAVRTACQVLGSGAEVAVLRLSLSGFDTHQNQPGVHANLLRQLAEGLAALRSALIELKLWDRTLVLSYAEFGRRPKENQSNGTDHGTSNVHFALGGAVRGGFHGAAPSLARLDGDGNLAYTVDFRRLYATVLERWWGIESASVLGARSSPWHSSHDRIIQPEGETRMKVRQMLLATMLSLGLGVANAQAPQAGPGMGPGMGGMGSGPRLSAEEREKRCQANPERCAKMKEKREKRREEHQAKRAELRKLCETDAKACEEKKAKIRENVQKRREARKEGRENRPPPGVK
jgi:hypothetical protein